MQITLDKLPTGNTAKILNINAGDAFKKRLLDFHDK